MSPDRDSATGGARRPGQKDSVKPMHEQFVAGASTCIDCHKGVAHKAPSE